MSTPPGAIANFSAGVLTSRLPLLSWASAGRAARAQAAIAARQARANVVQRMFVVFIVPPECRARSSSPSLRRRIGRRHVDVGAVIRLVIGVIRGDVVVDRPAMLDLD